MRLFVYVFFGLLLVGSIKAQYSTETLNSAIHKVSVFFKDPVDGKLKSSVGTGFLWQKTNQIVTSMHLLRENYLRVTVTDIKGHKTTAKVKKVYKDMDLMLLEVANPGKGWKYFGEVNTKVASNDQLKAIGYNSTSKFWLEKPLIASRTAVGPFIPLEFFIPTGDYKAIQQLGFPSVDKNMLAITGSLLPGYSGSPIFDSQGNLVAVGNGGLENGASNVSWGIPAKYLTDLLSSGESPGSIKMGAGKSRLFSSEVIVADENAFKASTTYKLQNGYEFIYVKTRKLSDLIKSSDHPEKVQELLRRYAPFNFDLENLAFDIYEEVITSTAFAVPRNLNIDVRLAKSSNSLVATNGLFQLVITPNSKVYSSLSEYVESSKNMGDNDVIEASEVTTTQNGRIRYVKLEEFDEETRKPVNYNYRKSFALNNRTVSVIGLLQTTGFEKIDFAKVIKNEVTDLSPELRERLRLKAIMEINMVLHTISNVKVVKEEKLVSYNWKVHGLSFGIPEAVPETSITSNSEEFTVKGDVYFSVAPLEKDEPHTQERLEQLISNLASNDNDLVPYDKNDLPAAYDLGGLTGAWRFFHLKDNPNRTIVTMYLMDPAKPNTRIFITLGFSRAYFYQANQILNSLRKYTP